MRQSNRDAAAAAEAPLLARLFPLAALCFAAVCANLSWIQRMHDADSILLAFISIDRYLPFYWGDNRYGMLTPWLARLIDDYRLNLLFQTQIMCLAAFGVTFAANVWFLDGGRGSRRRAAAVSALAAAVAMCLFRPTARVAQAYLLAHPYLLSLGFALVGVGLMLRARGDSRIRFAIACVCVALSLWVNPTGILLIAGFLVLLRGREAGWRARIAGIAMTTALLLVIRLVATAYPSLGGAKPAQWSEIPVSIARLWSNTFAHILDPLRCAVFVLMVLAVVVWRRSRPGADEAVFIALAVAFALSVASTDWVIRNLYEPRYWTLAVVLTVLPLASWLAGGIYDAIDARSTTAAPLLSGIALTAIALLCFGAPSVERATTALDMATSGRWQQVQQLGCTHMLGSYQQAWASVFYARSHGQPNPRFAVTSRSEATLDSWSRTPDAERKYCGVCDDFMNFYFRVHFNLGDIRQTVRDGDLCRFER